MTRAEKGANLAEVAILTPLLLLLLAGIVDLGWAYHDFVVVRNAAREGARVGSHYPWYHLPTYTSSDTIEQVAVAEAANNGLALQPTDVTVAFPDGSSSMGHTIQVTVSYEHPTLLGSIIGMGTVPLSSSTRMIIFGLDSPP